MTKPKRKAVKKKREWKMWAVLFEKSPWVVFETRYECEEYYDMQGNEKLTIKHVIVREI